MSTAAALRTAPQQRRSRRPKSASTEIFRNRTRSKGRSAAYRVGAYRDFAYAYEKPRQDRQSLQTDPVGYADSLNLYVYTRNDPLNKVDRTGQRPGDLFPNPADAAADAIKYVNPTSISENREYGGTVRENSSGQFYATEPVHGTGTTAPIGFPASQAPNVAGDYHTHGDYSAPDANGVPQRTTATNDAYNSNHFSDNPSGNPPADKQNSSFLQGVTGRSDYRSYLGTPSGQSRVYDPSTGVEGPLSGPNTAGLIPPSTTPPLTPLAPLICPIGSAGCH